MLEEKQRLRKGQVWRKLTNNYLVTLTGKTQSKSGFDYWHTRGLFNRKNSHRIAEKDILKFFYFEGYEWNEKSRLKKEYPRQLCV